MARTASLEAQDLYLRGRYFWNQRTENDTQVFPAGDRKSPNHRVPDIPCRAKLTFGSYLLDLHRHPRSESRKCKLATIAAQLLEDLAYFPLSAHNSISVSKSRQAYRLSLQKLLRLLTLRNPLTRHRNELDRVSGPFGASGAFPESLIVPSRAINRSLLL
jgi:hypothetical protein